MVRAAARPKMMPATAKAPSCSRVTRHPARGRAALRVPRRPGRRSPGMHLAPEMSERFDHARLPASTDSLRSVACLRFEVPGRHAPGAHARELAHLLVRSLELLDDVDRLQVRDAVFACPAEQFRAAGERL